MVAMVALGQEFGLMARAEGLNSDLEKAGAKNGRHFDLQDSETGAALGSAERSRYARPFDLQQAEAQGEGAIAS
jgi:hypothetical protein